MDEREEGEERGPEGGEGKGDRCIAPSIIFRKRKNERCIKTGKKSEGARTYARARRRKGGKARVTRKGERLRASESGGE